MLSIKGVESGDYFIILCAECETPTENEYLGGDPVVPHFKAICPKCGEIELKLSQPHWKGLPLGASNHKIRSGLA